MFRQNAGDTGRFPQSSSERPEPRGLTQSSGERPEPRGILARAFIEAPFLEASCKPAGAADAAGAAGAAAAGAAGDAWC